MYYNNNYYIDMIEPGHSNYNLKIFEYHISTDEVTVTTPASNLTLNGRTYTKLQMEDMTHIIAPMHKLERGNFDDWKNSTYSFIYEKNDGSGSYYTQEIGLKFDNYIPYNEIKFLPSNLTATSADVTEGKTFYNDSGIQTGTMQVLTYPYPYSEYHNYDYEFYEATAKSNVVRDGVSYVLASYQVVPGSKPDTWALTGNRKMKLGIPYSELASKIGLTADKIKAGVTILGITGTYTGD